MSLHTVLGASRKNEAKCHIVRKFTSWHPSASSCFVSLVTLDWLFRQKRSKQRYIRTTKKPKQRPRLRVTAGLKLSRRAHPHRRRRHRRRRRLILTSTSSSASGDSATRSWCPSRWKTFRRRTCSAPTARWSPTGTIPDSRITTDRPGSCATPRGGWTATTPATRCSCAPWSTSAGEQL